MIETFNFEFIEKEIRKKSFGILTTINKDSSPHSTGVLFGVSKPSDSFSLYILTGSNYKKVRNIQSNPSISFVIPFPHHIFRFVPSFTITIKGYAEIIPQLDDTIFGIFQEKRILRMITKDIENEPLVCLKIIPESKVLCYGVGINLFKLRRGHTEGGYSVRIPGNRLD